MRDANPRHRERFDLSLDGRQIASIVVGAIVVLAVVFVLGLDVGKRIARAERRAPTAGEALAALDQPPPAPAPAVRDEALTYHDRLVKERPAAAPELPKPSPPASPAPPAPAPVAPTPAPPAPDVAPAPPPAAAAPATPAPAAAGASATGPGEWCVQVGAANEREEADRIAARFERFGPRVVTAVVQGKTWHRVRVGEFATRAAAEKFLKDLARETGAKGYVTPNR